jgi:hypothetical protein
MRRSTALSLPSQLVFPGKEVDVQRDREREREKLSMHGQGIVYTRSFYIGLTSAEGQKLVCF